MRKQNSDACITDVRVWREGICVGGRKAEGKIDGKLRNGGSFPDYLGQLGDNIFQYFKIIFKGFFTAVGIVDDDSGAF